MRPTADEVMETVLATFDEHILPNVAEGLPSSLAITTRNLLRHVQLRMKLEAKALWRDNGELGALLAAVADYAAATADLTDLAAEIGRDVAAARPTGFQDLADLASEAEQLRWTLTRAIERLQQARPAHRDEAAYTNLREQIRTYLRHQLEREAAWIEPAFVGPRR
jgi:hypothetical protein